MPNPFIPPPVRPSDLPGFSLRELLDDNHAHLTPLISARHCLGEPEVTRLCADALDVLACG